MSSLKDYNAERAGGERKFWVQVPNIITEMGLSVYAVSLYLRIKRRAGDDGVCYETVRNMAKGCKMSVGRISKAKRELEAAGLIRIETERSTHGGRPYHIITIVDVWEMNHNKYSQDHHMTLQVSPRDLARSPGGTKEEPIKNIPEKEAAASAAPSSFADANEPHTDDASSRKHRSIQLIKEITGYYPRKNLHAEVIDALGDNPDIPRLRECFDTWTANGYNPQNMTWLFEWYKENMYYVPPGKKILNRHRGEHEILNGSTPVERPPGWGE